MPLLTSGRLVGLALVSGFALQAQIGPFPSTSVPLTSVSGQAVVLPMGTNPVLTNLVVDTVAAGGDTIDADVGDPAVVISLVTPSGKDEAIFEIRMLQNYVDKSYGARRFVALLMGAFAVAGALLAAVGLYALLSYMATMRRREAGIRMALGAGPGAIAWLMCGRGMALVATGAILGSIAAMGMYRAVASQLYGTQLQDPAAWLAALGVIGLTGLAACAIPAWRAARLDPAACLRVE